MSHRYPLKGDVIEVEWVDSTFSSGWREPGELRQIPIGPLTSIGYLLSRDKAIVRMVQSMSAQAEHVAGTIAIPMGCVTRLKTIRKGTK
jgi:anaerobic ribonucleoside-triphosphate reductase